MNTLGYGMEAVRGGTEPESQRARHALNKTAAVFRNRMPYTSSCTVLHVLRLLWLANGVHFSLRGHDRSIRSIIDHRRRTSCCPALPCPAPPCPAAAAVKARVQHDQYQRTARRPSGSHAINQPTTAERNIHGSPLPVGTLRYCSETTKKKSAVAHTHPHTHSHRIPHSRAP